MTNKRNEISQEIEKLKGCRRETRQELIKTISLKFISLAKTNGLTAIPRTYFKALFDDYDLSNSQINRSVTELINFLESNNKIKRTIVLKPYVDYRNKPLVSFDYGSFKVLMAKNGYKINHKDGVTTYKQTKPRSQQGVYTNSNKTIAKEINHREIITYTIL